MGFCSHIVARHASFKTLLDGVHMLFFFSRRFPRQVG